jgi:PAS domain S-box-containing protein
VVTDAIVVCDAAGSILDLNEEAAALFGIARAAATGKPSADLLIAAESQAAYTRSLRTLAGQKARLIATARRADGSTFEAEVRMAPGGADLRFLSFRDLSAELRNSEAASHLDAVLSAAPLVLFLLDDRGKITLSVGKALDRFGVNPNQHVGRELAEVYSHIPQVAEDVELALKGETVVSLTHNPRSGLYHETVYKPILGQGGVATSVIAVANDVTDHVRAEQAVEESEAKSRLLNVMNHEVRTPLNSILGFTDLLVGLRAGPLNKKQLRYLENIGRAGRHLLALVNDSLDLAKIEAGQMELALHDCEVVEVIEHTAALIEPLVESRGLELRLDAPLALKARADRRRLIQVLGNLASNAIKNTGTGGWVELGARTAGGQVEIWVADCGVGLAAEHLERIFEQYYQVPGRTDLGSGLGLAITQRLVDLMCGSISVESQEGEGSVFTVRLQEA